MASGLLADQIATPDGKRRYVRSLFATIADRYDFITVALSYGQDRRWKRRLVRMASPGPGTRALDLATGTGDLAFACAERGASVIGLDITFRMIEIAKTKSGSRGSLGALDALGSHGTLGTAEPEPRARRAPREPREPAFLAADMLALPFPSASFDLVTTGYGLRNVPNLTLAIDEIHRVLKPGGRLLSLDFNRPSNAIVRGAYLGYLTTVGGALGWALHRDPDTYRYIPASIRQYPGADAVARLMQSRGFARASYHPVLGGLMAIHDGVRD
jgi:demethylmenaquinone methyltransferase/2-methoxy-6-polyprenyl-1,4-benzoquinol methylase